VPKAGRWDRGHPRSPFDALLSSAPIVEVEPGRGAPERRLWQRVPKPTIYDARLAEFWGARSGTRLSGGSSLGCVSVRRLDDNDQMQIGLERFEELVADALDSLPEDLGRLMENVAVVVEEWPTADQMSGRHGTLLGLYQGIALTNRSPLSYAGVMPDHITIFRGPISQLTQTEQELVEIVTRTVIHEVAHHFGISDARLEELGWAGGRPWRYGAS